MGTARPRVYLAAPLFNPRERAFNLSLTEQLSPFADVYLPQRDGAFIADLLAQGMSEAQAYAHIFRSDVDAVKAADILILVMDGRSVDEGACFELGLAFSKNKTCVALKTDIRTLLPSGDNPMLVGALSHIFNTEAALIGWLHTYRQ